MNKATIIGIVAIAILAGGYMFVSHGSQTATISGPGLPPAASQVASPATSSSSATPTAKTFTVKGQNYSFAPDTITVHKGDTVTINFEDDDGLHDLVVDGYNVRTSRIRGGQAASVTFVASTAGSFEYYCSVADHREQGMRGTLVVQ